MKTELVIARYNEDVSWINTINDPDVYCTIYNKGASLDLPYIQLPNIGRESHTYLHHIINNYNNLADITIFCQGDSIFHSPKFMELIKYRDQFEPIQPLSAYYWPEGEPPFMLSNPPQPVLDKTRNLWIKDCPIHVEYVDCEFRTRWPHTYYQSHYIQLVNEMKRIYKTENLVRTFSDEFNLKHIGVNELIPISYAGLFAVHRDVILQHSKAFYQKLMDTLINKPMFYSDGRAIDFGLFLEKMWLVIFNYKTNNSNYVKLPESNFNIRNMDLISYKNTIHFEIYSPCHQIFLEIFTDRGKYEIQFSRGRCIMRDSKKHKYINYTIASHLSKLQIFKDETTADINIHLKNNYLTVNVNGEKFFTVKLNKPTKLLRMGKLYYLSDDNLVKDMFADSSQVNTNINQIANIPAQQKYAYAIIHFGSGISYIELELYFIMQLKKYTNYDIIYMYSVNDTPTDFIKAIEPFVHKTIGFQDVIKDVYSYNDAAQSYLSHRYTAFRTCNYIHAYSLIEYTKVCIIESDLVLMDSIDSIFELNAPATLCYELKDSDLNKNIVAITDRNNTVNTCNTGSTGNGGIMLIQPNADKYAQTTEDVKMIINSRCKYPNEALFQYSEKTYYNLPVKYNLSHHHIKNLHKYGLEPRDVLVFHFNETLYKHIDIIKENWNDLKTLNEKELPVIHFKNTTYDPHKEEIGEILSQLTNKYVALLFLTYSDIQFKDLYADYFKRCNVYIHPKYGDLVSKENQKYIIENVVNTEWGKHGIVDATVELLKSAFSNINNKYFILLSEDSCPLYSADKLFSFLNTECNLSHFSRTSTIGTTRILNGSTEKNGQIYKASQWFCLTRDDVNKIITSYTHFKIVGKITNSAPDEYYLFTLLKHYRNGGYKYKESNFMHTEWTEEMNMKMHPAIFNRLPYNTVREIKEGHSFFIRKTFPTFSIKTYYPSRMLIAVCVGTKTNQKTLLKSLNSTGLKSMDVIIISLIPYSDIIPELCVRCIKAHHIWWGALNEYILLLTRKYRVIYNAIYFFRETAATIQSDIFKTALSSSSQTYLKIKNKNWFSNEFALGELLNYKYNVLKDGEHSVLAFLNDMPRIMDYPIVEHRPLKYIHITKCGGTTIEELGQTLNQNWGIYDMEIKEAVKGLDIRYGNYWHVPPRYFKESYLRDILAHQNIFVSVRNPYSRVVSEYYYFLSGPKNRETSTKSEFNSWIKMRLISLRNEINTKQKKGQIIDGHWVPQYLFVMDKNNKLIVQEDHIIHLERINEEFTELMRRYNIHLNIYEYKIQNENSNKKHSVSDLTPENIQLINQIYAKDFQYFGYEKKMSNLRKTTRKPITRRDNKTRVLTRKMK